jgi:hypothetical protein
VLYRDIQFQCAARKVFFVFNTITRNFSSDTQIIQDFETFSKLSLILTSNKKGNLKI